MCNCKPYQEIHYWYCNTLKDLLPPDLIAEFKAAYVARFA